MALLGESGTEPLVDVKQTPAYRAALAAVIILGILIVIALGALVIGFVVRSGGHKQATAAIDAFVPPRGATLVSMEASDDRLILRLRTGTSEEVDIVDTSSGHLVARLKFDAMER